MKKSPLKERTTCNECGKDFQLLVKHLQEVECVMYDGKILYVNHIVCPHCNKAYPFIFNDRFTRKSGPQGQMLRQMYYKRYMGTVYQPASPQKKLDIYYAPERNNLDNKSEGNERE